MDIINTIEQRSQGHGCDGGPLLSSRHKFGKVSTYCEKIGHIVDFYFWKHVFPLGLQSKEPAVYNVIEDEEDNRISDY